MVVVEQEHIAHIIITKHMHFTIEPLTSDIWNWWVTDHSAISFSSMQWCLSEGRHTSTYTMTTSFVWCDRRSVTTVFILACWWNENKNPFLHSFNTSSVTHFILFMCFPLQAIMWSQQGERDGKTASLVFAWKQESDQIKVGAQFSLPLNGFSRTVMQQLTHINWQWRIWELSRWCLCHGV